MKYFCFPFTIFQVTARLLGYCNCNFFFFQVCFHSVSTVSNFYHGRSAEIRHFILLRMLAHSGENTPDPRSDQPQAASAPTLLPIHSSQIPPVTPQLFVSSPMLFPCVLLHVTINTFPIYLQARLSCSCLSTFDLFSYTPLDHFSGYFSHSGFLCLHTSRSTLKLPCSPIHALFEP